MDIMDIDIPDTPTEADFDGLPVLDLSEFTKSQEARSDEIISLFEQDLPELYRVHDRPINARV